MYLEGERKPLCWRERGSLSPSNSPSPSSARFFLKNEPFRPCRRFPSTTVSRKREHTDVLRRNLFPFLQEFSFCHCPAEPRSLFCAAATVGRLLHGCFFFATAWQICPDIFPLGLTSGRVTSSAPAVDAACRGREGDPVRPQGGRSAAAGADITRQGREGPRRRPRDTRRAGYCPTKETPSTLPQKGEYGGAGGVEGEPLSPHAPRRAGDPPPAPGSSRRKGDPCALGRGREALLRLIEHFQFETLRVSNHTACRFAEKTRFFRSLWAGWRCAAALRFTFFKVETL